MFAKGVVLVEREQRDGAAISADLSARTLLTRASERFEPHDMVALRDLATAAHWMQETLADLRGNKLAPAAAADRRIGRLLIAKYALAGASGLLVSMIMLGAAELAAGVLGLAAFAPVLLALCAVLGFIIGFYALECQLVFLVPAHHDNRDSSAMALVWRCRQLTLAAGGTISVMARVLVIAGFMLFGGLVGRGFLRSWCIGCVAVCIWYQALVQDQGLSLGATSGR